MGRRSRTRGWQRSAVILAAYVIVAAIPAARGIAAIARTKAAVPSELVGQWTRTISAADIKRTGGYGNTPGTVCAITVKKSGALQLVVSGIGTWNGTIVPEGNNRIHLDVGDPTGNVYRWRVAGRLLTLTKLSEGTPDRAAAMWGVWKRK